MTNKSFGKRKCKMCGEVFNKSKPLQFCCCPACAIAYTKKQNAIKQAKASVQARRKERAQIIARKHALETIPELTKKAQRTFNAYIRARDEGKSCISCNRPLPTNSGFYGYDAGHYRSVGAAPHLRFNENNVHGQCKACNNYKSGNVVEYRLNLIKRIGLTEVEAIESDNIARHYTKDDLREIERTYKQKLKELRNG